jgi:hypothetical protein
MSAVDILINPGETRATLYYPFNPGANEQIKQGLNGRLSNVVVGGLGKGWEIDIRDVERAQAIFRDCFGNDGSPGDYDDLVTVRVDLSVHQVQDYAWFAGRPIARRAGRDEPVKLSSNVVLVEGKLSSSGGSMKYPTLNIASGTIVEIRDLPRKALEAEHPDNYEIVGEEDPKVALAAEKERLLARVAEIDALLA